MLTGVDPSYLSDFYWHLPIFVHQIVRIHPKANAIDGSIHLGESIRQMKQWASVTSDRVSWHSSILISGGYYHC